MDEKATIYDYVRLCKETKDCRKCVLGSKNNECGVPCENLIRSCPNDANKKILDWCKTHPVKTRQRKLLKIIPTARIDEYGVAKCKPCEIDDNITCNGRDCTQCRKEYWSEEVEENV